MSHISLITDGLQFDDHLRNAKRLSPLGGMEDTTARDEVKEGQEKKEEEKEKGNRLDKDKMFKIIRNSAKGTFGANRGFIRENAFI